MGADFHRSNGIAGCVPGPMARGMRLDFHRSNEMRILSSYEIDATFGGATASGVNGCPPTRTYDVIDCPQSSMGNMANDIANGVGQMVSGAIAIVQSWL